MKICFAFDHVFPADDRAGRHIETLVRRFMDRGHDVFVITTPVEEPFDQEGIEFLRLRETPGAKGHARRDSLMGKAITKFLKENEVQVVFAEGLTPLSAITVKAGKRANAACILRVLADASGIVHSIGGERRLTPSALKKRIATMLGYADIAAASSAHCADLLREFYEGETRVIEKCVDLAVFNPERVADFDLSAFRDKHELGDRTVVLYAREDIRAETVKEALPTIKAMAEARDDVVFTVAGRIDDPEDLAQAIEEAELEDTVRLLGRLSQRELCAAYSTARLYFAPRDSRASESELLEAMAMACAVACSATKAEIMTPLIEKGGAIVLPDESEEAARELLALLDDADRLGALQEKAIGLARESDISHAVDRVHELCEDVLGLSAESEPREEASDEEAPVAEANSESETDSAFADAEPETEDESASEEDEERPRSRRRRSRRRRGAEDQEAEEEREASTERAEDDGPEAASSEDREDEDHDGDEGEDGEEGTSMRRRRRRRTRRRRSEEDEEDASESGGEEGEEEIDLEAASQRLRELDPRLTLRDLMPFLRPPKSVFVMSFASEGGQHRAGDAINEAFRTHDQNLKVRQLNIFDYLGRGVGRDEVTEELARMQESEDFRTVTEMTGGLEGAETESDADAGAGEENAGNSASPYDRFFDQKLRNLILEKRPDQLVLTHYLPLHAIAALKRERELRMKISVIVTEYDFHPHWMADGVDQYHVPNEKVRYKMMRAGVPSNLIEIVGVPVHPRFEEEIDRDRVKRDLGLKTGQPTVMLRPGGLGDVDGVVAMIAGMMSVGANYNLVVLAGRNESLLKALKEIKVPRGVQLKCFGFVDDIRELMGASDLLITKASGHTMTEAIASGLPMLLAKPAPGVESRTADWFVEQGVALKAQDAVDLEWYLSDLLRGQGRGLRDMRDRARNEGRASGGAARKSVSRICKDLN